MHQVVRCYHFSAGADPYYANTVLLLSGDGASGSVDFPDDSAKARGLGTIGGGGTGVDVATSIKAFGSGSIRFDSGRDDDLYWADSADWSLGSGDFTIEGFFYHEEKTVNETLVSQWRGATGEDQRAWLFRYRGDLATDALEFVASSNGSTSSVIVSGNWSPTVQTWYYYCVERSGDTFRIYAGPAGGTASMLAKATSSIAIFNSSARLHVGSANNNIGAQATFYGDIDELRITKGVARYATDAGFAVPTEAFPRS
jgi:hypothetical protein